LNHLLVEWFELLGVAFAKNGERGVIDRATRGEPDEVDRVCDVVFDLAARADLSNQSEQQNLGQHAEMNGRLSFPPVVGGLPA
jgi:hypothetical protein